MSNLSSVATFVVAAATVSLVACAMAPEREDPTATEAQPLAGCHTECPKCPPGKICPMLACRQVCNKPGACATDADCRLFSDYCTGCDCRALSTNEADPTCSGPGVRCLADPCGGHTAACVNGSCTVQ